jgi:hypothetical protein
MNICGQARRSHLKSTAGNETSSHSTCLVSLCVRCTVKKWHLSVHRHHSGGKVGHDINV